MTAGYDEWAAARTPALLALASALTDDDRAAHDAVVRALDRTRGAWSRVAREDPDLEARREVVRTCASPRRAAVVLRAVEGRTDAEIADVLRCSEATVRRHLQRRHDQPGQVTPERAVARAGSAATQVLTRPPSTRAHDDEPPAEPRRRRAAWASALAVVALLGGVAFVAHASRTPAGTISYPRADVPPSWRYESYAGVQLQVPGTWGWGAAPIRSGIFDGPRHLGSCGTNQAATLSPLDDASYVSSLTPFVGRPSVTTERCVPWGSDGAMPSGEAVWFDSPLEVGVKPLGPTTAETRAVGEQHVTVFAPESAVRRQVLGTVEEVGVDAHGCPTRPVSRATAGPRGLVADRLSVCVYSQDTGATTLMFSASLTASQAAAYADHVAGATATRDTCATPHGQWVALGLHGSGGTRWDVADLACDRLELGRGRAVPLTSETVRDWATGGVTAYVAAPARDRALEEYFRAPTL